MIFVAKGFLLLEREHQNFVRFDLDFSPEFPTSEKIRDRTLEKETAGLALDFNDCQAFAIEAFPEFHPAPGEFPDPRCIKSGLPKIIILRQNFYAKREEVIIKD